MNSKQRRVTLRKPDLRELNTLLMDIISKLENARVWPLLAAFGNHT